MMRNNLKIAVTGGIGSGKSTLMELIAEKGFPCFSCDAIYREVSATKQYLDLLKEVFSECVKDGELDRKKLSAIVFSDSHRLELLNSIAHPLIMETLLNYMQNEKVSFAEVPLLFEGGFESLFDVTIVVVRDLENRIESVLKRDNVSRIEVIKRINNQFDYDTLNARFYFVVHNNGTKEDMRAELDEILKRVGVI